jgi:hypothetical protein
MCCAFSSFAQVATCGNGKAWIYVNRHCSHCIPAIYAIHITRGLICVYVNSESLQAPSCDDADVSPSGATSGGQMPPCYATDTGGLQDERKMPTLTNVFFYSVQVSTPEQKMPAPNNDCYGAAFDHAWMASSLAGAVAPSKVGWYAPTESIFRDMLLVNLSSNEHSIDDFAKAFFKQWVQNCLIVSQVVHCTPCH